MRFSNYFLNEFVAPGLSEFTSVEIPDLRADFPQAPHWLANHILNSAFRARFKHGIRQIVIAYLRRSGNSFDAYHRAREMTVMFMQGRSKGEQPIRLYFSAVDTWETFILQSGMVIDLFRHLNEGKGAFSKNDGSPEQRLYNIANQIKHTASCIASGQCTEKDTLPLWLSNHGLESFGLSVSFNEAAKVLTGVSKLADKLQNPNDLAESTNDENIDQNP
jgi:hypothetical protein